MGMEGKTNLSPAANRMVSRTVSTPRSASLCSTYAASAPMSTPGSPLTVTCWCRPIRQQSPRSAVRELTAPDVAGVRLEMTSSIVDLPAPDGPMTGSFC